MVLAILVAIGKTGAKGLRYAGDVERLRKLHCEEAFCLVDEKPPVALRLGQEGFSSFGSDREGLAHQNFSTPQQRSEEHTSELQSLMRISYAVICLKKKIKCITEHNS